MNDEGLNTGYEIDAVISPPTGANVADAAREALSYKAAHPETGTWLKFNNRLVRVYNNSTVYSLLTDYWGQVNPAAGVQQ